MNRYLSLTLMLLSLLVFTLHIEKAYAFFDQKEATLSVSNITIGDFTFPVAEWDPNVTYQEGDRVLFNGFTYEANEETLNDQPDSSSAWRLVEATLVDNPNSHPFDERILDATITLNGVLIVENGVINTANADAAGITVLKEPINNVYWIFEIGNAELRIRDNGNMQYRRGFTLNELIVELP